MEKEEERRDDTGNPRESIVVEDVVGDKYGGDEEEHERHDLGSPPATVERVNRTTKSDENVSAKKERQDERDAIHGRIALTVQGNR